MAPTVTLRLVEEDDLVVLGRLFVDPTVSGEFEWFGYRPERARELERRWKEDGLKFSGAFSSGKFAVIAAPVSVVSLATAVRPCTPGSTWPGARASRSGATAPSTSPIPPMAEFAPLAKTG